MALAFLKKHLKLKIAPGLYCAIASMNGHFRLGAAYLIG